MQPSEKEKVLYEKWIEIYKNVISKEYPKFDEKKVQKLAQENARFLISVFTPATIMEYTVNFQQLNFIISWFEDYIENEPETTFSKQLKQAMREFLNELPDLKVEELNPRIKGTKLSLFAKRERTEEFGENYCTTYLASFAQVAQAQRHRTLSYEITLFPKESLLPGICFYLSQTNMIIKNIHTQKL